MLSSLKLHDFRCFPTLEFEAVPGPQFFIGDNAQGKTSVLEAICVLLRLASPRSTALLPLIRTGTRGFAVQGRFNSSQLQFYFSPERKKLRLDEVDQTGTSHYLKVARLVYFGNNDLDLIRGSAEARRRFLDFLGSQIEPLYRANLRAYERALRSRNRLLKAFTVRRREVEAYDAPLIETGELLTHLRRSLVAELAPWADRSQRAIRSEAGGADEALALEYQPGAGANLAESLAATREDEARLRQTLAGPHRDDVAILVEGQPAGSYASEGQQRTLALALRLAQAGLLDAVWNTPPVLLLDDTFGELDPHRRNALVAALPPGAQQFIATTRLDWLRAAPTGPVWRVADRRLERVKAGGG